MKTIHWKEGLVGSIDAAGAIAAGGRNVGLAFAPVSAAIPFGAAGASSLAIGGTDSIPNTGATLTTLASFKGADGKNPQGSLIADAAGDLFGTTAFGGANGDGTVFEIVKTAGGYASAPRILASFTGADGAYPQCSLTIDAAGNLLGTTPNGGANDDGTVFELAKTRHGYASVPTALISFTGADGVNPQGGLTADAAGNLFGVTESGGANGDGTVFEVIKTPHGYASAPTVLASFTGANGQSPLGSLITDAAGDLFGTTSLGGADGDGTVFEIVKTKHGYASAPTTLVSFTGANGSFPQCTLIADAAGDLFGTTNRGGSNTDGEVFEIEKTVRGYAKTPKILAYFTGANGRYPEGSLIIDAAGDLFGRTISVGTHNGGTVFEIVKTGAGYAKAPTTLINFTLAGGGWPTGGLIADAAGNLLGTTEIGGSSGDGSVFQIANSGYVPTTSPVGVAGADAAGSTSQVSAFVQAMAATAGRGVATGPISAAANAEVRAPVLLAPRGAIG